MENDRYPVATALKLLKAGYHLAAIIDRKEEDFFLKETYVLVSGENKSLRLSEYQFLELYQDSLFSVLDDTAEDAVDPKKDEEYYSWRQ